jgi:hypothetical protein
MPLSEVVVVCCAVIGSVPFFASLAFATSTPHRLYRPRRFVVMSAVSAVSPKRISTADEREATRASGRFERDTSDFEAP